MTNKQGHFYWNKFNDKLTNFKGISFEYHNKFWIIVILWLINKYKSIKTSEILLFNYIQWEYLYKQRNVVYAKYEKSNKRPLWTNKGWEANPDLYLFCCKARQYGLRMFRLGALTSVGANPYYHQSSTPRSYTQTY